jgi:hypothetical protein
MHNVKTKKVTRNDIRGDSRKASEKIFLTKKEAPLLSQQRCVAFFRLICIIE